MADKKQLNKDPVVEEDLNHHFSFWSFKSVRFHAALLMCFAVMMSAVMRGNISVAVVCMVNNTAKSIKNQQNWNDSWENVTQTNEKCMLSSEAQADYEGTLDWDSHHVAMLFWMSFVAGYFTGVPAGYLSDRYGPKNLLLLSGAFHIIGTLLTPVTSLEMSFASVVMARFVVGLGQGLIFPCLASMVSRWFPPAERSVVIAIYTTGNQIAAVLGNPASAFLCKQKHVFGGWPSIFYFSGIIGLIWAFLWQIIITNSPDKNRLMCKAEKLAITEGLDSQQMGNRKVASKSTPWKEIITSSVVWANMISNLAGAYHNMLISFYLPTYLKDVLFLDLKSNGLLSALPWLSMVLVKFITSPLADHMRKNTGIDDTVITKFFNAVANFGPAVCLILLGFVDCTEPGISVALLCVTCGTFACNTPGFLTSMVLIAPSYSGTIGSFARVTAQTGAVLSLFTVGAIAKTGSKEEWQIIFLINAAVCIFAGVFFTIFGSAKIQDWAQGSRQPSKSVINSNGEKLINEAEISTNENQEGKEMARTPSKVKFTIG